MDALTWRLQEAEADLERIKHEAGRLDSLVTDSRLATLLEEDPAFALEEATLRVEQTRTELAREEGLVQRLHERRMETRQRYRQALQQEWIARLMNRWREREEKSAG